MATRNTQNDGPGGGLQTSPKIVRKWRWDAKHGITSAPVRCRREQWYLVRGVSKNGDLAHGTDVIVSFIRDNEVLAERCVPLSRVVESPDDHSLLGWIESPDDATHLQVRVGADSAALRGLDRLVLHPVADRDPKCHPHANIPRWSAYKPPFTIRRVVLPASLEGLDDCLTGLDVQRIGMPRSRDALAKAARGAVCIVDPQWVYKLGLRLGDIERLASGSVCIIDLEIAAELVAQAGKAATAVATYTSPHEIMSARVDYADFPTRGFALQDVLPFATVHDECRFRTRVLRATRAWKRYADGEGFATLLASETPWEGRCGDVLSASRAIGGGELMTTDLPWLVAGQQGRLLAPRLARHLLRMHVGAPIDNWVQYWNRWDDGSVVLRDLADLARRYAPLRAIRWAAEQRGVARLGLTLAGPESGAARRHLMIRTGRIDAADSHDGLPPEPLAIFMKQLAREAREGTAMARRLLADTRVTWQFDTADGLRYATRFNSAARLGDPTPTHVLRVVRSNGDGAAADRSKVLALHMKPGIHGDGSLACQARLTRQLLRWIETAGRRG